MEEFQLFAHSVETIDASVDRLVSATICELRSTQKGLGASNRSFARKLSMNTGSWESIKYATSERQLQLKTLARIANARGVELASARRLALRAATTMIGARALKEGILDADTWSLLARAQRNSDEH